VSGSDGISRSWIDLHRVRASFDAPRTRVEEANLRAIARTLGATVVPLCVRELPGAPARRAWALDLLRSVAQVADERVRIALREFAGKAGHDEAKLAALALLAELGDETATGRFDDPQEMHQQSLARFAHQLASPAEIASAADLLVSRLAPDELVEFVEAFSEADPDRARALGDELAARVDLDVNARGELSRVTAPLRLTTPAERPRRPARALGRPALLAGLRHADGRVVIAVARRVRGESRWRSLAVLCGADGQLDSVRYADDTTPREVREAILAPLLADGYQRFALTATAAQRLIAAAARCAVTSGKSLPSPYYLGRDLLGLADSHLAAGSDRDRAALLGRAIDLLAGGAPERARPLLAHCAALSPDDPDAQAHLGLCLLRLGDFAAAVAALTRAAWLEPAWPLHHWNLAAAAHRAGDVATCARALHAFLDHAGDPLAHAIDASHGHRVALARRFLIDHGALRRGRADDHGLAPST
jgi:tetratricopeptide (TPR) repeat protein